MKSGVLDGIKQHTIHRVFRAVRNGETLEAAVALRYLAWVEEAERVLVHCGPELKSLLESISTPSSDSTAEDAMFLPRP